MSAVSGLIRRTSHRMAARFRSHRIEGPPRDDGPRIAILSASVGAGHVRAARAIQASLSRMLPQATIAHVDVLQLTNGAFRRAYGAGYFRMVEHAPHLVGIMYDLLDRPGDCGPGSAVRLGLERANLTRLTRFLTAQPWDLVINTHFLAPGIVAWLNRTGRANLPQVTAVTDFDVHGLWINHPTEAYFVATQEAKAYVARCGVDRERVHVTGIPIDPVFERTTDRAECRRRHGVSTDRPMVLQMAGGFGIGSVERIYQSICDVTATPLDVCVVTGNNAAARARLAALGSHPRHRCQVIGFTTQVDELMAAADIVVSKPGGLTTSESLARGCPMVVVEPIPGQEDRNSDFLLENGCAIKANNLATLTHKLDALLGDGDRLGRMRLAAWRCGRPDAAARVAEQCVRMLARRASRT